MEAGKDLPALVSQLVPGHPAHATAPPPLPVAANTVPAAKNSGRAGRIASVVGIIFWLATLALLSALIYDGSPNGIAYLFGQFLGSTFILLLLALLLKKWPYRFAAALLLSTAFVLLSNRNQVTDALSVRDMRNALSSTTSIADIDDAAKRSPSNPLLQLLADAASLGRETEMESERLISAIEPDSLKRDPDYASMTRAQLESYRRDLATAERNASNVLPTYIRLLGRQREEIERRVSVTSLREEHRQDFMRGLDSRRTKSIDLARRSMEAHAEVYAALGATHSILIEHFGKYEYKGGQFYFSDQNALRTFNAAQSRVAAASERMAAIQAEYEREKQTMQDKWKTLSRPK
jgi:hypothetical protein